MSAEVLSTPELLEQILVQLPIRDLLITAPLVSKTWHAVTLSPTLQRALFFAPDPLASASKRVQNPLLMETFPPFFIFRECARWPGSLHAIETMPWFKAPDAFGREEASWRRMLVSQPPVQTMIIVQKYFEFSGLSRRRAVLENLSLRMGVLYDLVVLFINDNKVAFRFHWDGQSELGGDLKLSVVHRFSRADDMNSAIDPRFRSDGEKPVEIPFGEWELEAWN